MNTEDDYQTETDDPLLRNLLELAEPGQSSEDVSHDADELFELFAQGQLAGEDREEFLQRLDADPPTRRAMSAYLNLLHSEANSESETLTTRTTNARGWSSQVRLSALALAACLLLAVGLSVWRGGPAGVAERQAYDKAAALAASASYDEAQETIQAARAAGVESTRLELLAARVAMHEPKPFDSAEAWSLRSFDYQFDGALMMDAEVDEEQVARLERASAVLDTVDPAEQLARLARARLLLRRNKPTEARDLFETILAGDPTHPAALMGLGVANFMLGGKQLDAAEASFRTFLKTQPDSFAGRLNLAMCLSEAGKLSEAVAEWQKVDLSQLPPAERAAAEQAIADLEQGLQLQG